MISGGKEKKTSETGEACKKKINLQENFDRFEAAEKARRKMAATITSRGNLRLGRQRRFSGG